ncbi:DUF4043 family protein [Salmonella enterica]|uniref:Uncharacterized protein n=1 Tax=Salmonella newport TaxID=108619 RepID=A0A5U9VQ60_SALNE|nr:hypothetical protein [Salmonella enterica subsp. enterica serovar Newport]EHI3123002.1 DUF4043 family protein [Salmonella enterica]
MINDVIPSNHNRHFFGSDATFLDAMGSSDVFFLSLVDDMAHPSQPFYLKGMNCSVKIRNMYFLFLGKNLEDSLSRLIAFTGEGGCTLDRGNNKRMWGKFRVNPYGLVVVTMIMPG